MQVVNVVLSGGHIQDSEKVIELVAGVDLAGKKLLADRTYSCDKIRTYRVTHGASVPDKVNFKVKHDFDVKLDKQRNLVERFFQRIKNYRHIALRQIG